MTVVESAWSSPRGFTVTGGALHGCRLRNQSCAATSATEKRSAGSKRSIPRISDSSRGSTSDGTVNSPLPMASKSLG